MRRILLTFGCLSLLAVVGCSAPVGAGLQTPAELGRIAGWKGADLNSSRAFRFVVMSDRTGGHEPGAWARAVAEVNRLKPDFVMCVGDLIEGYTNEPEQARAEWEQFDRITRKLEAPFFYCSGNHDVASGACRKVYTRLHGQDGRTYYSFDYRGCHFVVLDSTAVVDAVGAVADAQWAWLEKDLAAARSARHVFVFMHHPLYRHPQWPRLRKMLNAEKTTIFAGHTHTLSYDEEDGVPWLVLGRTAAQAGPAEREKGGFQMFAHVAVAGGRPAVSLIPLGEVLPHDFISRALAKRVRKLAAAMTLSTVTRAGGEVTLELRNPTDAEATYTLAWTGAGEWFAGGPPEAETLAVPPGGSARKVYTIRPARPEAAPPTLEVAYGLTYQGAPGGGKRKLPLPVAARLTATRVAGIRIDGKLDDWAGVAPTVAAARWHVRDNPDTWSGLEDCLMKCRIGYDDRALYLAVDVTDEALVTEARQSWYRDGVEVFWDPRPPARQDGRFAGPCRQLLIPVPAGGEKPRVAANPADEALADGVRAACLKRKGGYTFELAIPHGSVAKGFRPEPGGTLRMEVFVNDRDGADPRTTTSCTVLSGDSDASRNTAAYAVVTFK